MKGLESLFPHLITIFLIWVIMLVLSFFAKRNIFKGFDTLAGEGETKGEIEKKKNDVNKTFLIFNSAINSSAIIFLVIFLFFIYNPTEREAEDIPSIKEATVDETFVEPTSKEIEESNKKIIEGKHKEKEVEAREDNIEAMEDSIKLFRKIGDEAE